MIIFNDKVDYYDHKNDLYYIYRKDLNIPSSIVRLKDEELILNCMVESVHYLKKKAIYVITLKVCKAGE